MLPNAFRLYFFAIGLAFELMRLGLISESIRLLAAPLARIIREIEKDGARVVLAL
jgi:hypothetical protein